MDPSALAPGSSGGSSGSGPGSGALPPLPDWVLWLQAGFTALVAVLFVALLLQSRQQNNRIQELQERLQGLENSRALERTTGLEDQLRASVERLQALERDSSRIDLLQAETDALREQLSQLRPAGAITPPGQLAAPTPAAPTPPAEPERAPASAGAGPPGPGSVEQP
ncbi:MAG: hypothetical protein AAFX65_11155 [Cyanobacteria bacterium J06638_7]